MTVRWRKSSYSGSANDDVCVELGRLAGAGVAVRDSKDPDGGHLVLTDGQFATLLARLARVGTP